MNPNPKYKAHLVCHPNKVKLPKIITAAPSIIDFFCPKNLSAISPPIIGVK